MFDDFADRVLLPFIKTEGQESGPGAECMGIQPTAPTRSSGVLTNSAKSNTGLTILAVLPDVYL